MCTLSWWVAETERGVLFNRDEKRTRSHGLAPEITEAASACRILAPRDPDAGGTWIGVNDAGLVVAVLNNYPFFQAAQQIQHSRGRLVLDLLAQSTTAAACMQQLSQMDVTIYPGFLLFALGRVGRPLAKEWDGESLADMPLDGEDGLHVLTSSSHRRADCQDFRHDLFAGLSRARQTLRAQHGVFLPEDPALGPVMVREDAATDSISEVVVGPRNARMWFQTVRGNPPVLSQAQAYCLPLKSAV